MIDDDEMKAMAAKMGIRLPERGEDGNVPKTYAEIFKHGGTSSDGVGISAGSDYLLANAGTDSKWKAPAGLVTTPNVMVSDDRPLIDKLQEATFRDDVPTQWVVDKYALRMLLRKAHCFNVDAVTSAMISDFSLAIASDLEAARHLAIPPFPVTWFDVDNHARLKRTKELGISLTKVAGGDDVVPRVGWLITSASNGYIASYVAEFNDGIFVAPTSFHWSINDRNCDSAPVKIDGEALKNEANRQFVEGLSKLASRICFGIDNSNTDFDHVTFGPASFQGERFGKYENEMMRELWGELRHIWGLLIALGTATAEIGEGTRHAGPMVTMKGKPLLPLEHKLLKIHLGKKRTVQKIVGTALHGARMRWHEVRAHTRLLKSGRRVPVKSHARGDELLGKITKTYEVKK